MLFRLVSESVKQNCVKAINALLANGGKEIVIRDKRRSLDQNAYYFNVVEIIGDYVGVHKEEMHDQFKVVFLGVTEFTHNGKVYHIPRSTRTLSTKEFSEYMEKVIATGMGMGLTIPPPKHFGG